MRENTGQSNSKYVIFVMQCTFTKLSSKTFFKKMNKNYSRHCVKSVRISPYSAQMRENTEKKNFEYGHFSRSAWFKEVLLGMKTKNAISP